MKILSVTNSPINGCGFYRQIIPHLEMHRAGQAEVMFTNLTTYYPPTKDVPAMGFTDNMIKKYDIIQYHKGYINFKELIRFARLGIRVVCDFDDYWDLPLSHGLYNEYNYVNKKENGKTIFAKDNMGRMVRKEKTTTQFFHEVLRKHEYITTTTPLLAEQIYPYNKNVEVLENALHPLAPMMQHKPTKSDKYRFGWLGGSQHWIDIQLLRGVPNKLWNNNNLKGNYELQLYGYMGNTVYDNFAEIFTDYKKIKEPFKAFPPLPAMHSEDKPSYLTYYNNMDCALVPLADTKFNSLKSELKVVEAGFFKKPVIVSNVYPYKYLINDTNSLIVRKPKDWFTHTKKLILNPNLGIDLGEKLYEDVIKRYHVGVVNERRLAFYKSIIAK